ncbi:MAG TPA: DUF3037 domain-containing protein [Myxococcaceae bacterium]|nr:DUF3037 domain-containing protein [Myxococcaceae bacterium]
MPGREAFDYAVVRVVPRVEREEFVNAGVVVHCRGRDFLRARFALDERRLLALAPDVDLEAVRAHLEAFARVCDGGPAAGPLGGLSPTERFHWVTSPRSTVVQTSPVHAGLCEDPDAALAHLVETVVRARP